MNPQLPAAVCLKNCIVNAELSGPALWNRVCAWSLHGPAGQSRPSWSRAAEAHSYLNSGDWYIRLSAVGREHGCSIADSGLRYVQPNRPVFFGVQGFTCTVPILLARSRQILQVTALSNCQCLTIFSQVTLFRPQLGCLHDGIRPQETSIGTPHRQLRTEWNEHRSGYYARCVVT